MCKCTPGCEEALPRAAGTDRPHPPGWHLGTWAGRSQQAAPHSTWVLRLVQVFTYHINPVRRSSREIFRLLNIADPFSSLQSGFRTRAAIQRGRAGINAAHILALDIFTFLPRQLPPPHQWHPSIAWEATSSPSTFTSKGLLGTRTGRGQYGTAGYLLPFLRRPGSARSRLLIHSPLPVDDTAILGSNIFSDCIPGCSEHINISHHLQGLLNVKAHFRRIKLVQLDNPAHLTSRRTRFISEDFYRYQQGKAETLLGALTAPMAPHPGGIRWNRQGIQVSLQRL